ncbi:hypothetical protein HYPSUDRAFT_200118 [Hypholoma sublateritium FD-334 SS-4]|uniref:Uncharacterized protein n=1 Tax=Hypholoma sublateritium (strain FD-334 SS-4) TaxID=945553 RepID=A0A0D2PZS8_HYPSF|nr:hypothetical protein HYPSUDRAFT_200118 [Hypholoma sublateritium FD-334 SS-4]
MPIDVLSAVRDNEDVSRNDQPCPNTVDHCFLPSRIAGPLPSQLGCGFRLVTSHENERNAKGGGHGKREDPRAGDPIGAWLRRYLCTPAPPTSTNDTLPTVDVAPPPPPSPPSQNTRPANSTPSAASASWDIRTTADPPPPIPQPYKQTPTTLELRRGRRRTPPRLSAPNGVAARQCSAPMQCASPLRHAKSRHPTSLCHTNVSPPRSSFDSADAPRLASSPPNGVAAALASGYQLLHGRRTPPRLLSTHLKCCNGGPGMLRSLCVPNVPAAPLARVTGDAGTMDRWGLALGQLG